MYYLTSNLISLAKILRKFEFMKFLNVYKNALQQILKYRIFLYYIFYDSLTDKIIKKKFCDKM